MMLKKLLFPIRKISYNNIDRACCAAAASILLLLNLGFAYINYLVWDSIWAAVAFLSYAIFLSSYRLFRNLESSRYHQHVPGSPYTNPRMETKKVASSDWWNGETREWR